MSALRRFLLRAWNALLPGRAERDLRREVVSHLALLEDEFQRQGLNAADASLAARRALGGVEAAKDAHRDARSFVWVDDLRRDLIYAVRTLARTPVFAAVAVVTLGLSIGATTAIFSVVDHVLLRSLPLPHADRLVRLYESNAAAGRPKEDASPAHVAEWRAATKTLELVATIGGTRVTMIGEGQPESLVAMQVGPEFFALTGVTLALGRPFDASEYSSSANASLGSLAIREPVTGRASIILGHALWLRQFGGDPDVVGREVRLNGTPAVIAGVMPSGFRFDESTWGQADCWLPHVPSRMMAQRRFRQYPAIGRLRPDVSPATAQGEMIAIAAAMAKAHPKDDAGWTVRVERYQDTLTAETKPTLLILLGGVVCVLLIACANIASLFLLRATGRSHEVAVRMAIGAGRSRLVRQWLTESTLLALLGGFAGFLISLWAVPVLVANSPLPLPRLTNVAVDSRVLGFTVAISLITGALCGLAPALGLSRVTLSTLRSNGALRETARHRWLRPSLLAAQIGLAVVLLVGAGLMARTLAAVYGLDLGFNPGNVLTFNVDLRAGGYQDLDAYRRFSQALTTRLAAQPGVEAAGVGGVPLQALLGDSFLVEGRDGEIEATANVPGPGYFKGLGLRFYSGRAFSDQDDALALRVAIVNRAFARAAWGSEDALGKRLHGDAKAPWMTVVGVVDDIRVRSLEADAPPMVFVPFLQSTTYTMSSFVVRTSGTPSDAVPMVRDVVRSLDSSLAITRVATMDEKVSRAIAPRQFNAWLIAIFSSLALVVALVGIYGLISETVSSRTPEIGVRMALGATRLQVVRLVAAGTLTVTLIGIGIGLAGAAAVTRSLGSMLFGVPPLDPITLITVPLGFMAAALVGALMPARRATKVNPVIALRHG